MEKTFHASIWFRPEKPLGAGRRIAEGWCATIISGLRGNEELYTGACATKEDAIAELVSQLKQAGYSGKLKLF